jgi:hypothetical protein
VGEFHRLRAPIRFGPPTRPRIRPGALLVYLVIVAAYCALCWAVVACSHSPPPLAPAAEKPDLLKVGPTLIPWPLA